MTSRVIRFVLPALLLALVIGGAYAVRSRAPNSNPGALAGSATDMATGPASSLAAGASSLAVDASDGSLLKADGGLFRSTDRGRTWQPLPLPAALKSDTIHQVATSAAAPSRLYAAGLGAGVIRSDDRGQTWRPISAGLPSQAVSALAVHSFRPDTLYVWIGGQGLFRTEDGGGRWAKMDDRPPTSVAGLAHSTLEGSMNTGWLYAATPGGPYLSMDCF